MTALTHEQREAVADHMPLIERIASMESRRFSRTITRDDALSSAMYGACKAMANYTPDKKASKATHIGNRARGQVIDDMRMRGCQSHTYHRHSRRTSLRPVSIELARERMSAASHDEHAEASFLAREDKSLAAVDNNDSFEALVQDITDNDNFPYFSAKRESVAEALRLIYRDGIGWNEAATRTGVSQSNIYKMLRAYRHSKSGAA